ncbi:hypothetical protein BJ742DRAFT_864451 [Cladochytrium replicatum]|nr:hypothetical protein BJ742DRAFT_864451 [Cladochytrium replicatum]
MSVLSDLLASDGTRSDKVIADSLVRTSEIVVMDKVLVMLLRLERVPHPTHVLEVCCNRGEGILPVASAVFVLKLMFFDDKYVGAEDVCLMFVPIGSVWATDHMVDTGTVVEFVGRSASFETVDPASDGSDVLTSVPLEFGDNGRGLSVGTASSVASVPYFCTLLHSKKHSLGRYHFSRLSTNQSYAFVELYQMKKQDFAVAMVTMAVTLFATVQLGLFIGIGFSLFMIVYRSAHPHWTILGELSYKPGARQYDGILILRFGASLFFANFAFFQDTVIEQIEKRGHGVTDADAEDTEQAAEYVRSRSDLEENRLLMQGRDRVHHLLCGLSSSTSTRGLYDYSGVCGMQGVERSRTRAVHFLERDDAAAIRRLETPVASPRAEIGNGGGTTLFSQFPVDATISSPFTSHAHASPRLADVVASPTQEYIDCAWNGQLHRDQFFLTVQGAVAFASSFLGSSRASGGYGTM